MRPARRRVWRKESCEVPVGESGVYRPRAGRRSRATRTGRVAPADRPPSGVSATAAKTSRQCDVAPLQPGEAAAGPLELVMNSIQRPPHLGAASSGSSCRGTRAAEGKNDPAAGPAPREQQHRLRATTDRVAVDLAFAFARRKRRAWLERACNASRWATPQPRSDRLIRRIALARA